MIDFPTCYIISPNVTIQGIYLLALKMGMDADPRGKNGPSIVSGSENARTGKIMVTFTGGTNPSKELYMELAKAGVGTLVEMHIPEESLQELKKAHINAIDVGHMAADSIGANLFLDELEKKGVAVIPASGLIRVRRIKSSKK